MSLPSGTRLGSFEVTGPLGAGGMGEVYRARDTNLGRDVALKILPTAFASDADRLMRFEREARTLAALNHPHIAQIHGFEQDGSIRALVLEYVEGPTLAERISAGPLPIDEVLGIARQLIDALEAAHVQGIVHRDLKPANVKLSADGNVKVLDFGLAKAFDPVGSESAPASVSLSPTLTAATQVGVILGTASYMSPEQARGRRVDRRADIWAFGCVLFEMLTGARAFPGDEIADVLAFVITREPELQRLPAGTPSGVRTLLRRCFEKDPRRRLADIADARYHLDETASPADATATSQKSVRWRAVASAGLVAVGLILGLLFALRGRDRAAPFHSMRLSAELGADASVVTDQGAAFALSPDGQMLAFAAQAPAAADTQLYKRRLDELQAVPVPGTNAARLPFFSPNGEWIGFFADGKLKKVPAGGGPPVVICDAPRGRGGSWGPDDTIVFAPESTGRVPLQRVSAAGGHPETVTTRLDDELVQRYPQVLPGGTSVLYTVNTVAADATTSRIVVQQIPSGERHTLIERAYAGRYISSGHLLFVQDSTLFAAPVDLRRAVLAGPAVPILEGVTSSITTGGAQYAVSESGTLVYLPGALVTTAAPVDWLDQDGTVSPLRAEPLDWSNPQFSPDGKRLAMDVSVAGNDDIWVYDWQRDAPQRLTSGPGQDGKPIWTPDGTRIVFSSRRNDLPTRNLYWQRADGTGEAERLLTSDVPQDPGSWHPSGKLLAFTQYSRDTFEDIMLLPIEGDEQHGWTIGTPRAWLKTPGREQEPTFSPDGKWIAYVSQDSGRNEVYVQPFPGPGRRELISNGRGTDPVWSPTRNELFYWPGVIDGAVQSEPLFVVPFRIDGDRFVPERPKPFGTRRILRRPRQRDFAIHPDGRRFAASVARAEPQSPQPQRNVVLMFNFAEQLQRLSPGAR